MAEGEKQGRVVVVAVDPSEHSSQAAKWAASNLVHPGDRVLLLHVQPRPDLNQGAFSTKEAPLSEEAIESIRTHISGLTRRTLDKAKEHFSGRKAEVEAVAKIGDARDVICQFLIDQHADMLVIGSRGHGPLKRQLLGSVSSFCVHNASVPVVVVRTE